MKKEVLIIGGGFAGIQLARHLDKSLFKVTLIDKINHHQFQPLFYQVATSQIEPSSISFPLRHIFKGNSGVQVRLCEVTHIHTIQKCVTTNSGDFKYDFLVLANGCSTNFFGNTAIVNHVFTLKSTADAIGLRNHILEVFESSLAVDEYQRLGLMNLVIVGAGPTGVELAGAFAEIKKEILPKDYPGIKFSDFTIYLVEGSANTLNAMSHQAKSASADYLCKMGVELVTNTFVKNYDGEVITLSNGQTLPTKTVIWAAGVSGNRLQGLEAAEWTTANRVIVDRFNAIKGVENVYAVGDIACMYTPKYPKGHPQLANVAINQSKTLAKNLKRSLQNVPQLEYEYKDLGSMATIGRNKAVVDLPFLHFKGYMAWLVWMFLHLMLILSVRNKLIIFINWAWAYITRNSSLRLILRPSDNRVSASQQDKFKGTK
jgi:NADH dehydrogenase